MDNEEKRQVNILQKSGNGSSKIIGIIAIVIVVVLAGFLYERQAKHQTATGIAPQPQKEVSAQPQPSTPSMAKSMFKDGTYTAEGDYITHVGQKHIKVTITLKNDIITDADVVNEADDPTSDGFQDSFISGYKPMVIGKDISKVHLGKVALSSLTPNGFNSALQTIEQQAKS